MDRAPDFGSVGCGFDSCLGRTKYYTKTIRPAFYGFFSFFGYAKKETAQGLFFDSCFFRPGFFPHVQGFMFRASGEFSRSMLFLFFA